MSIHLKILIIIISLSGMACTNADKSVNNGSNKYIHIPVCNVNNNYADSLIVVCEAIPLETNENCLISNIHKLHVTDNYLYVWDRKLEKIYIFDHQGHFVNSIHNQGNGPDKYISINGFEMDTRSNKIVLSDSFSRRIFIYDETGEFQKTIPLSFVPFNIVPVGNGMYYNLYGGSNMYYEDKNLEYNCIHVIDSTGKVMHTLLPDQTTERIDLRSNFTTNIDTDSSLLYNPILSDTIYKVCTDSVSPYYVFSNHSNYKIPSLEERKKIGYVYGVRNDYEQYEKSGYLLSWGGFLNTDNYMFFLFGWNKTLYLIYSKENLNSIMISRDEIEVNSDSPTGILLKQSPYTAYKDWFYTSVMAFDIDDCMQFIHNIDNERLKNVSAEDNPVLIRYKIKF